MRDLGGRLTGECSSCEIQVEVQVEVEVEFDSYHGSAGVRDAFAAPPLRPGSDTHSNHWDHWGDRLGRQSHVGRGRNQFVLSNAVLEIEDGLTIKISIRAEMAINRIG